MSLTGSFYPLSQPSPAEGEGKVGPSGPVTFVYDYSDRAKWDAYAAATAGPDGGLLQSWLWGEVQRRAGRSVRRFALVQEDSPQVVWQMIERPLPWGQRYWYLPRPAAVGVNATLLAQLVRQTGNLAYRTGAIFLRLDAGIGVAWRQFGFRPARVKTAQPAAELIVDVGRSAEQLISAMKQKTRYNIRLSQKYGVTVSEASPTAANAKTFFALVAEAAARQGIRVHPPAYYETVISALADAGMGRLLVASLKGVPLAAALVSFFNGVVTYLHGGSAGARLEVMAPYALHWFILQLARRLGAHHYNFGGVSQTVPSWAGITRFKQGFAPTTPFTEYGGTWERPILPWRYRAYCLIRTFPVIR